MASGKEIRDRIFALSGALLFFISAIALTVAVVLSNVQENKAKQTASQTSVSDANKLEGTKLSNFTPTDDVPELKTEDLKVGSGKEVTSVNDTVTADYTGALASTGVIFQSSLDSGQPFTTQLTGVIEGWQKGLIGMKEGGERRLIIPSAEAYGPNAQQGIPANSNLVFDITLHKVQ
jgi:FKBP-type peptidyl-prolyl cis-trans isomerase